MRFDNALALWPGKAHLEGELVCMHLQALLAQEYAHHIASLPTRLHSGIAAVSWAPAALGWQAVGLKEELWVHGGGLLWI